MAKKKDKAKKKKDSKNAELLNDLFRILDLENEDSYVNDDRTGAIETAHHLLKKWKESN